MKSSADYEPTHPELIKSPAPENQYNLFARWGMRIVAIILFCLAINCFIDGNHERAAGLGVATILLLVVSFCTDFGPRNTY